MSGELWNGRRIGPRGTAARVLVGTAMIATAALFGVGLFDVVLALVVFPIAVALFVAIRGRSAAPLRFTGPVGHCLNCAMILAAFIFATDAALLFYGVSMLVAAVRGSGGCELFAVSNWLWRRDDEIACPFLWPIDRAEPRAGVDVR